MVVAEIPKIQDAAVWHSVPWSKICNRSANRNVPTMNSLWIHYL